jgi:hypothetical protein
MDVLKGLMFIVLGAIMILFASFFALFKPPVTSFQILSFSTQIISGFFLMAAGGVSVLPNTAWADAQRQKAQNALGLDLARHCHAQAKLIQEKTFDVMIPSQMGRDPIVDPNVFGFKMHSDTAPTYHSWMDENSKPVKWLLCRFVFRRFKIVLHPLTAHQRLQLFAK